MQTRRLYMPQTMMEREAEESALVIEQMVQDSIEIFHAIKQRLQNTSIHFIATLARGSSDHAALFAKYAFERYLQVFTASIAPSLHTLYQAQINYKNSIVLAISQSGQSPDLVASMNYARQNGALTVSLINQPLSPLAAQCEINIPLLAGNETAVAATKSFIASIARIIQLVAFFNPQQIEFNSELLTVAKRIQAFQTQEQHYPCLEFKSVKSILILGRGFTFPIAMEAALKLKETCGIHAEAYSAAEVLHGPVELVQPMFPIILFLNRDETLPSLLSLIAKLRAKQAKLYIFTTAEIIAEQAELFAHTHLNNIGTALTPLANNILFIYQFYKFAAQFAKEIGRNPDAPTSLNKVTSTI